MNRLIGAIVMTLIFIGLMLLNGGCTAVKNAYPSIGKQSHARVTKLIPMSNGYTYSLIIDTLGQRYYAYYECIPDTVKLGSLVRTKDYSRVITGSKMKWNLLPFIPEKNIPSLSK